ncbi:MAG TPA: dihydropteroate synthase [Caldimonas sp.]|nr:dihydropteroate synthase [Caldimonas sp.]
MSGPIWRTSRFAVDLARPRVMGIVNVTPDSFSEGGAALTTTEAIVRCERLVADGADILDIGGESSRPGALPVSADAELARVRPVLEAAVGLGRPVSIDTTKVEVMRAALDLGVDIVNDIGALRSPGALALVAAHPTCGACLMHMRGTPRSMQAEAVYDDVAAEVATFLRERVDAALAAGIARERIVVDPGIGFGKTPAHNLALLAEQEALLSLGVPLLVGWSRKSTLARLAGLAAKAPAGRSPSEQARLEAASVVAAVLAVQRGARIVRVHDVAATVAGLAVWQAVHGADNRADPSSEHASTP